MLNLIKQFVSSIPKIAHRISGGSVLHTTRNCLALWYFFLTRKLGWRRLFPVTLQHKDISMRLYLLDGKDIGVVEEVYQELFVEAEYDWKPFDDVTSVIDLGAHYGDTTLYYRHLFPNARIVAMDPIPDNVRRIRRACTDSQIYVLEGAVSAEDGKAEFHLTPSTLGASLIKRAKSKHSIVVTKMSLKSILTASGLTAPVDLIKFDIEGGEFDLFASIDPKKYARAYIGEVHCDYVPGSSIEVFLKHFEGFVCTVMPTGKEGTERYMVRAVRIEE